MAADTVKPRNIALDALKGLCIILMVIGHSGAPQSLVRMISCFHMPAFFIISGFLFKEKYISDLFGFLRRKMKTLWWPFVFWTLIYLFLHNFFAGLGFYGDHYSPGEIVSRGVKGMMMRQTEPLLGGLWFLTSLLFASVAALLYYRIFGMRTAVLGAGIAGCLLITECIKLGYLPEVMYFNAVNFQATAFFITGTLISRENLHTLVGSKPTVILAIASLTIGTFWLKSAINLTTALTLIPYYVTASIISWGLIVIFWRLPHTGIIQYLSKIGSYTLDILIFHFLAMKIVTWIRVAFLDTDPVHLADFPVINFHQVMENPVDFYWIAYTVVGLTVSILISRLKEKSKKYIEKRIGSADSR